MIFMLMSLQQKIDVKIHCCLGTTLVRFIGKYNMLHKQMICDYIPFGCNRFIVSCLHLFLLL